VPVDLALPDLPPETSLGHCVRCGEEPLRPVRVEVASRGFLFVRVPAWRCPACGEVYHHMAVIERLDAYAAAHAR
jgi:uncharacterized Zn finger protein